MRVSALFLPGVREEAVPWVKAEADPDEMLFDDDVEEEDWEDLDEPDELLFDDEDLEGDDWDDEDLEEEFEGYVADDDEDGEIGLGW